jgi:hypothetical protein
MYEKYLINLFILLSKLLNMYVKPDAKGDYKNEMFVRVSFSKKYLLSLADL